MAIDNGGPAFPHMMTKGHKDYAAGLSLRDYFAGQALALMFPEANAALARQMNEPDIDGLFARTAQHCYRMADAMLSASKKGQDAILGNGHQGNSNG